LHRPVVQILIAALVFSCTSDEIFLSFSRKRPVSSRECGVCHEQIFAEWSSSFHALAWARESYTEILALTDTVACWACHAPVVYSPREGFKPDLRESNLMEGVNCTACHADICPNVQVTDAEALSSMLDGPWQQQSSRLCGTCHISTYEQWLEYAEEPGSLTCVECHMRKRSTRERMTGPDGPVPRLTAGKGKHRGHSFPRVDRGSMPIHVKRIEFPSSGGITVEIVLENRVAGHSIPSALYGYREARLEAWLDDAVPDERDAHRFFVEMGTALTPGINGPYHVSLAGTGKVLNARLVRVNREGEALYELGRVSADIMDTREVR
jgi:hypothetical protein